MRKIGLCLAAAVLAAGVAAAKPKSNFPQVIVSAKYVYVTTYYGSNIGDTHIPPEDLRALADVEQALRKWGRYSVTLRPENAELIVVVRKGRLAAATIGGRVGTDSSGRTRRGPIAGIEAGMPDDSLEVYLSNDGDQGALLWRRTTSDGLEPPEIPLLKEFRRQVDEAAARKP